MPQLQNNRPTADDINTAYKQRYITAADRNKKMRRLAGDQLEDMIGEHGMAFSYFKQTLKHVSDNWAEHVKMVEEYKPKDDPLGEAWQRIKTAGLVMWREIAIVTAPFTAIGEVNGKVAEHYALQAGASPGLAKVVNVAVDVGSGFIPIGKVSQLFAKGVQKMGGFGVEASKAGKATKAAAGADNVMDAAKAEQIVDDAITQGLKADGVELFRGGDAFNVNKIDEFGLSLTTDKSIAGKFASDFGGGVEQFGLKPGAKIGNFEELLGQYAKEFGTTPQELKKYPTILPEMITKWVKEKGLKIDAIDLTHLPIGEKEIRVLNPDALIKPFVGPASTQQQFISDLRKFKAEMAHVTETKTHEMTAKEAEKLGLTVEHLRGAFGEKVSEAEMYAGLKALEPMVDDIFTKAKAGAAGNIVAGDAALKALGEFFEFAPKFRKAEVTAGRSVEILKENPPMKSITDMLRGWDAESLAKLDFDAAKKTILEDLAENADQPAKLLATKLATDNAVTGPTRWEQIREVYINLLLARPVTQVRNFIGNSYAAMNSMAERELAGWLSIDEAKGVVKGEGMAQFQGMMAGMSEGLSAYAKAFTGVGDDAGKLDFIPHKIGGAWGRFVNVPGDSMRGMDNFFKTILQRGDIYAQALNRGRSQGLDGSALADYAARHAALPSQAMIEHAKDFSLNQTFQNDLGTYGKYAQKLLQYGPMSMLFPFMKTPMNLAKYSWNRTPGLQFLSHSLYDDILAGGQRTDMAIARLTLSNMMGMFWYGLAQQGLLTGGGPVDPGLRRIWGKQPYAFAGNANRESFAEWKSKHAPNDSGEDYDLQAAYEAGLTPDKGHFSDIFKKPNHPTFSIESTYWKPGMAAGRWEGEKFIKMNADEATNWAKAHPEIKREPPPKASTGTWWQPGQLDPATTSIWMAADFAEVMNQLDDPTAEQTAMAISLAGVRDIVDKSYWQTVGQAVDFIGAVRSGEEPGRQAMRLIQGPLVTAASGGPLSAGIARAVDPVRREARGFMDQVRARVPGFSESMPPMRDGWGDPMVPPQPLGGGWAGLVSPLSAKGYEQDAIKKEGARLQAKIPLFPWSIGGKSLDDFDVRTALPGDPLPVDLSPKQRDRWQVIYREILRHPEKGIEPLLLNNPEYQNTPFAGQRNAYMNFLAIARQGAKDALMVEDDSLRRKEADATTGKYLPMLRPEMRPQVEAQISEGLDLMESLAPQERANLEAFGIMGDGKEKDAQSVNIQLRRTTADTPGTP